MNAQLKPLPWQETMWLELTSLAQRGQLTHALLLTGPPGIGKRHFARALSAFLLCENRGTHACGACRGCQQFAAGSHPNASLLCRDGHLAFAANGQSDEGLVHWEPKKDSKRRDIATEAIRSVIEYLNVSGHYGGPKQVVIDPADELNTHSVNSLLKLIEEPPANTFLMLIAERAMALPATLRSRCQRLRFAVPAPQQAMAWLREHGLNDPEALPLANGAPLLALELKQAGLLESYREWARGMQDLALHQRDPLQTANLVGKDRAPAFLNWLQQWLTQMLRLKLSAADGFAQSLPRPAIEHLLRETLEGQRRLRGNAQPQLLIESLMILWWRMARGARAA